MLRRLFGHADFRGLQAEVIAEVLAGRNALAVLPTGGGKSVCYQIPALLRAGPGPGGLAADRADGRPGRGAAASWASRPRGWTPASTPTSATRLWRRIEDGELDLLYVSPEGLMQPAHAGAAGAHAAGADRHRRGPLRQPVGPRLPARIPHAGPAGRAVPRRAAPGAHRHRRRPHPRGHPRRAAAGATRASSSTASPGPSWRCRPSASTGRRTRAWSSWSRRGRAARASSMPARATAPRSWPRRLRGDGVAAAGLSRRAWTRRCATSG